MEHDVGPAGDRREVVAKLGGQRLQLGAQRIRIGFVERGMGRVLGAQRLLDALNHGGRVVRIEPGVAVDGVGGARSVAAPKVPVVAIVVLGAGDVRMVLERRVHAAAEQLHARRLLQRHHLHAGGQRSHQPGRERLHRLGHAHEQVGSVERTGFRRPQCVGVRRGQSLDQQQGRADPRHHLRHQRVQRLDGHDHLGLGCH